MDNHSFAVALGSATKIQCHGGIQVFQPPGWKASFPVRKQYGAAALVPPRKTVSKPNQSACPLQKVISNQQLSLYSCESCGSSFYCHCSRGAFPTVPVAAIYPLFRVSRLLLLSLPLSLKVAGWVKNGAQSTMTSAGLQVIKHYKWLYKTKHQFWFQTDTFLQRLGHAVVLQMHTGMLTFCSATRAFAGFQV